MASARRRCAIARGSRDAVNTVMRSVEMCGDRPSEITRRGEEYESRLSIGI